MRLKIEFKERGENVADDTKTKLEQLAQDFIDASFGKKSVKWDDLKIIGIKKKQKTFKSSKYGTIRIDKGWFSFCAFVYEKAFKEHHPGSTAMGRGFRSQDYGGEVAKRIRKYADELEDA